MRTKCGTCLCRTCLNTCCDRKNCTGKKEACGNYSGFKQLSIFDTPTVRTGTPRYTWEYYGISKARYRQLEEYIQSGRYASLASQAAHIANETIAEYLIISIAKNKSYDALEKMWARGEIDRIPYGKTDFYGVRRYFIACFDKEVRRIGK